MASAADSGERYEGGLEPAPRYAVRTEGARGGTVEPGGRFPPGEVPGPVVDAYGAGDAFAAGLTYGLASGMRDRGVRWSSHPAAVRQFSPAAARTTARFRSEKGRQGCAAASSGLKWCEVDQR